VEAVEDAGGNPELVSLEEGENQGFNHYDEADRFTVDRRVEDVNIDEYDALVVPAASGVPTRCGWTRARCGSSGVLRVGKATGRHLRRAMDARRGRRRARSTADVVLEHQD
jgi:putative intracellular protease/amidase